MNARNLAFFAFSSPAASSHVATFTWDGGDAHENWSSGTNWSGEPVADPANGDTLIFAGQARPAAGSRISELAPGCGGPSVPTGSGTESLGLDGSGGLHPAIIRGATGNGNLSFNPAVGAARSGRSMVMGGEGRPATAGTPALSRPLWFPGIATGNVIPPADEWPPPPLQSGRRSPDSRSHSP